MIVSQVVLHRGDRLDPAGASDRPGADVHPPAGESIGGVTSELGRPEVLLAAPPPWREHSNTLVELKERPAVEVLHPVCPVDVVQRRTLGEDHA